MSAHKGKGEDARVEGLQDRSDAQICAAPVRAGARARISVGYLIHLKFFFQLGNVMYETLFPTYIKDNLSLDPSIVGTTTGYCLGWVGVVSGKCALFGPETTTVLGGGVW